MPKQGNDGGLGSFKSEKESTEEMEDLGYQFDYGCHIDKLPIACHSLGQWYAQYKRDEVKARREFQANCETNKFGESCLKYANYLLYGRGGLEKPDPNAAFSVFLRNCEENAHDRSCHAVAMMAASGMAADSHRVRDEERAQTYFEKACAMGFAPSCFNQGEYLMRRAMKIEEAQRQQQERTASGVNAAPQTEPHKLKQKAAELWDVACKDGHPVACLNLSVMYLKGDGVTQDLVKREQLVERTKKLSREIADSSKFVKKPLT